MDIGGIKMPKCYSCGLEVEKEEAEKVRNYNFHPLCAKEYREKLELQDYICDIFNYKKPGPRIQSQIKTFVRDKGYTYRGIKKSLQYHYEVRNGDKTKSNGGIGIVPYIYEEAKNYYRGLEGTAKRIAECVQTYESRSVDVMAIQRRAAGAKRNKEIDLSSIE